MGLHERFNSERAWSKKQPGIAAGSDIEKAAFGLPITYTKEKKDEYMPYGAAIDFAKDHQPNPLTRPKTVKELRGKIVALCSDTTNPLKFYTAVGTPLDTYHGIDAFFELGGCVVTLDVSGREKELFKADVLLFAQLNDAGELVIEKDEMDRVAREVATLFNRESRRKAA